MAQQPTPPDVPDAYDDLGLESNASSKEIRAAYHKLALRHHPDKQLTMPGPANNAAEFRRANEAYEQLKDKQKKSRYDQQYTRVRAAWAKYKEDMGEFTQNPEAWRKKQASASQARARAGAASQTRAHTQYCYDDSDDIDDDYEESAWNFFDWMFGFGGAQSPQGRYANEARRAQNEREFEDWFEQNKRAQREYDMRQRQRREEESAQRMAALERERAIKSANERAIKLQQVEAETTHSKSDGIRVFSSEEKLAMAKAWVQGIQRICAQELNKSGVKNVDGNEGLDLGWEKKKGRQTCHFCDAHMQEYSYCCPSGGAIACRACKNGIASSSLKHPFAFVNTHLGAKKSKGRKRAKKANTRTTLRSDSEESVKVEEDANSGKEAERLAADVAAQEQEAERLEKARVTREARGARREAERKAQEKAAREAEENAAREKIIADTAAREKAASDEVARKAEAQRKEARAKKLQEEKAQKKYLRKKAAKERAAVEKARGRSTNEDENRPHREAREEDKWERTAREARVKENQGAEDVKKKEPQQVLETATRLAREPTERLAEGILERQARAELLRAEQKSRNTREKATRLDQEEFETRDFAARAEQPMKSTSVGPDQPTRAIVEGRKKPSKNKAPRPPPVCFVCNEKGHGAHMCPDKRAETSTYVDHTTPSGSRPDETRIPSGQELAELFSRDVNVKTRLRPRRSMYGTGMEAASVSAVSSEDASKSGGGGKHPKTKRPHGRLACYACLEKGHMEWNCPVLAEKGRVSDA